MLRHSCLLAKHAMALSTVMLMRLVVVSFVGVEDTSPKSCFLLPWDPNGSVDVRYRGRYSRGDILDMG